MSVPLQALLAFVSVLLADVFWGLYIARVAAGRALGASVYAVALFVMGALAVLTYVNNNWMLVPAAAGAFVGTYLAVRLEKRKP